MNLKKELQDAFYQSLFTHNPNASYLLDENGNFISLNKDLIQLTGYSKEELFSMDFLPLFRTKEKEFILKKYHRVLSGEKEKFQTVIIKKDHSLAHINITAVPVFIKEKVRGIVGIAEDITEEMKLQEKRENELEIARKTQISILPKPMEEQRIQIDGIYLPSEILSGDMYSWSKMNNDIYVVSLMDVMGHGVSSSLIAMAISSHFRGIIPYIKKPDEIMSELNHHIFDLFKGNDIKMDTTYLSAIILFIDLKEKSITYFNAGHPSGLMLSGEKTSVLRSQNIPVGLMRNTTFVKQQLPIDGRTRIALYTDGLIDSFHMTPNHFLSMLKREMHHNFTFSNAECLQSMQNGLSNRTDRPDDIAYISITIT